MLMLIVFATGCSLGFMIGAAWCAAGHGLFGGSADEHADWLGADPGQDRG